MTVHTCTGRPARCAERMKRRDTTFRRPARSGTWNPRYGVRPSGRPSHDRYSDHCPSSLAALVGMRGSSARTVCSATRLNDPMHTRCYRTSPANRLDDAARGVGRTNLDLEDQRRPRVAGRARQPGSARRCRDPRSGYPCVSSNQYAASTRASSAAVRASTGPCAPVQRSRSGS